MPSSYDARFLPPLNRPSYSAAKPFPRAAQVERVQRGGELPPWYDLSEWDDSGDTPAAESHSVSLQVRRFVRAKHGCYVLRSSPFP